MNIVRLLLFGVILIGVFYIVGIIIPAPPLNLVTNAVDGLINGGGSGTGAPVVMEPASEMPVTSQPSPEFSVPSVGNVGSGIADLAVKTLDSAKQITGEIGQVNPLEAYYNPRDADVSEWIYLVFFVIIGGGIVLWILEKVVLNKGHALVNNAKSKVTLSSVFVALVVIVGFVITYLGYKDQGLGYFQEIGSVLFGGLLVVILVLNVTKLASALATFVSSSLVIIGFGLLGGAIVGLFLQDAPIGVVSLVESTLPSWLSLVLQVFTTYSTQAGLMGVLPMLIVFLIQYGAKLKAPQG